MSLGPFKTGHNGSIFYGGNRIFEPIKDVRIFTSPDLSFRHIELKRDSQWKNLMIIYDAVINATRTFMKNNGAIIFDLPITTRMISSPGALNDRIASDVRPFEIRMFDNDLFLTQSSQLYLEFAINAPGIDKVYCIDKSFRMEHSNFRHLPEFTHVEFEANIDFNENIKVQEAYLKFLIETLVENYRENLTFFLSDEDIEELLKLINSAGFERIKFEEAFKLLRKKTGDTKYDTPMIHNLSAYEELLLTEMFGNRPVFVTHYIADEVAFYHALDKADSRLAINADLLFPGYGEIIGSGERVHTREETMKKAAYFDLDMNDYRAYIESRDPSNPKIHSGWGMGIERFIQSVLKMPFIWDAKVFPRVDNSNKP